MGSRETVKLETRRAEEVRARMVDMDGLPWADGGWRNGQPRVAGVIAAAY
jgi:hypothetical protein